MTPLFNLFGPVFIHRIYSTFLSIGILVLISSILVLLLISLSIRWTGHLTFTHLKHLLFPLRGFSGIMFLALFSILIGFNTTSLIVYRFPVSTVIRFSFRLALSCWMGGVLVQSMKRFRVSFALPSNSPWYLVPFLGLVELIRVVVRPLTLCFRLLANITAGHILITLASNISLWEIGILLAGLEFMVSLVQAFVFSILISVYIEEALRH